jgi:hypothetical protein
MDLAGARHVRTPGKNHSGESDTRDLGRSTARIKQGTAQLGTIVQKANIKPG